VMILDAGAAFGKGKKPQTKKVAGFLKALQLLGKKVLFVADASEVGGCFVKSMRNIPQTHFMLLDNLSGYDVMSYGHLIMMGTSAADRLVEVLGGSHE
jgi:ribosomal protein L4